MLINSNKTEEMIIGKAKPDIIPYLEIVGNQIKYSAYNSQTT